MVLCISYGELNLLPQPHRDMLIITAKRSMHILLVKHAPLYVDLIGNKCILMIP